MGWDCCFFVLFGVVEEGVLVWESEEVSFPFFFRFFLGVMVMVKEGT